MRQASTGFAPLILGAVVLFASTVGAAVAVDYARLTVLPVSHWLQYSCIRPVEHEYSKPTLFFESCLAIHRPVNATWYDRVTCEEGDASLVQVWSEQRDAQADLPRRWPFIIQASQFHGSRCELVGSVVLALKYGISKKLHYTSDSTFGVRF